jgi:GAF domain-containing protein
VVVKKTSKDYYHDLYEVASVLNSESAHEDVLRSIVQSVAKAIGAKACSLMLLTPDGKILLHTFAYGLSEWYLRKGPIKADKSISEALKGKPIAVFNAGEDERIMYREQAIKEGIASILSVPITLRGKIIGVLRVYTAKPYRFTKNDISFAETVANLGAVALENLRAYDVLQKEYEDFRIEMLQWRAELGDEWYFGECVTPAKEQGPSIPPGG